MGGADFSDDLFKEVYDNELPIIAADGGANFLAENNIYRHTKILFPINTDRNIN